jgi:hypothetical protein
MINIVDSTNPNFVKGAVNVWDFVAEKNPELIESMVNIKSGVCRKLYARKCKVEQIDGTQAELFFNTCHTKGHLRTSFYFGLFHDEELVQVMSFGEARYSNNFEYEIIRLATTLNTVVVGGASKLLNAFMQQVSISVHTYSETMLGDGNVYQQLGFAKLGTTKPGYFWLKDGIVISRSSTQKHKLHKLFPDLTLEFIDNNTEAKIMTSKGYRKVQDLGNSSWGINEICKKRHKYHYVYKITRPSIDCAFYFGIHSTDDLNDGYLGSGNRIRRSVSKHGVEKHVKEIIQQCSSRQHAIEVEKSLVTSEILNDRNCLNLVEGGYTTVKFDSSGMVAIFHDLLANSHMMIYPDEFPNYESLGWKLGSRRPKTMGVFYTLPNDQKIHRGLVLPENATRYFAKTTKNYKWVMRGDSRRLVPHDKILETDVLCPEVCATIQNKKLLFKDGKFKYFDKSSISQALDDGWELRQRTGPQQDRVHVVKGDTRIAVSEQEAIHLIKNEGWTLGRIKLSAASDFVIRVAKAVGMRIPSSRIDDDYVNPPKPKNKSGASTGKISIKKYGIKKMIDPHDARMYVLGQGWELGAASCWRLASESTKQLGIDLGYDVENNQKQLHK